MREPRFYSNRILHRMTSRMDMSRAYLGVDDLRRDIEEAICEARAEAFEEAAQRADGAVCVFAPPAGEQMSAQTAQEWVNTWCAHIADRIRALKEPLG